MLLDYKVENIKQDKDEFVTTIVINKQGNTFRFIRKNNLKLDPGKKDLISGHIKTNGETPMQAMYREIREETGIRQEEILQCYSLGTMELPHVLLKGKTCHVYCIVIDYTEEQLNQSIQERALEQEVERAERLDNTEELLEDIKDKKSNWRVYCSKDLVEKINMAKSLIEGNKNKKKELEK